MIKRFGILALTCVLTITYVLAMGGLLLGCSKRLETGQTLVDEGILALSPTNAYLGSNIFIAREAERSNYFFNFLKGRGAPDAIRVREGRFSEATIQMFYTHSKEMYVAELEEHSAIGKNDFRQWIVRGPFAITRSDYRELSRITTSPSGVTGKGEAALFQIYGKPYRFGTEAESNDSRLVKPVLPPAPPIPKPTPQKKTVIAKVEATPVPAKVFTPLNSDQMAIMISQGYAERAANGDLIHTVKTETETLADIAKWYTGSATNATAILASNATELKTPEALTIGTRIKIAASLITQTKAMP